MLIPQIQPSSLSKQSLPQRAANTIGKYIPDKLAKTLEMGQQGGFARGALVGISILFVLGARFIKSRDNHERREVLTRDASTIFVAMLGVPVVKNLMSRGLEKVSKIPIADERAKFFSLADFGLDNVRNWYSKVDAMSQKSLTMAKQIKERGGDVKIAFSKLGKEATESIDKMLQKNNLTSTSDNIIKVLETAAEKTANFTKDDGFYKGLTDNLHKIITQTDAKGLPCNGLVKTAQRLKAIPAIASILLITAVLGWGIPAFNIYFTRNKLKHADNKNDKNIEFDTVNFDSKLSDQQKQVVSSFMKKA